MKKIYSLAAMLLGLMGLLSACVGAEDTEIALSDQDPDNLVYNCDRQTVVLRLDCNRRWKASASEDWIEIKEASGKAGSSQKLTMILSSNGGYAYRTAEITVKAGKKTLVLTLTQAPEIIYYVNENFDDDNLIVEAEPPQGWFSIDDDGDGWGWRCLRDAGRTYVYSASYLDYIGRSYAPDNYLVTPRFALRSAGFVLRWDSATYDVERPGDKYEVYVASYTDGEPLQLISKVYEGATEASAGIRSHEVSLDSWAEQGLICIAFRHFDSANLGRVLITNVEVSNRR